MSKIGKKPIIIPEGVEINIENNLVKIKGPRGENEFKVDESFEIIKENSSLKIVPSVLNNKTKALWGTIRAILNNKIIGVKEGFKINLILQGLGYTVEKIGEKELIFKLGYSHPVKMEIPEGIEINIEKSKEGFIISVIGNDKEKVGRFASLIRALKPRDAYKLKGFRYEDEVVRPKPIKKSLGK